MKQKVKEAARFVYYFPALSFALIGFLSFEYQPFMFFSMLILSFGIIPVLELFLKPVPLQVSSRSPISYDLLLYSIVVLQYVLLYTYLNKVSSIGFNAWETIGLVSSMGILCGVYGINVAHELGHRNAKVDRFCAKALLLTSLYMHFHIEHNRGHHKRVGTPEDPATARLGEGLYRFWVRSIWNSYLSAYRLESERLKRAGKPVLHWSNSWLIYQLIQLLFAALISLQFGWIALCYFLGSAAIGILLLETINYVEHYGLRRNRLKSGVYERVQTVHSWNSDHPLGRYLLFELSRHSDHHQNSLKKYPTLESHAHTPQLPTGYPGMMLLAMIPPLWKHVMMRRISQLKN